jgi:hypothetical protein
MAPTLDEAQYMTEVAERNEVQLLCGHTANRMTANQALRRLITSCEIGYVRTITSSAFPGTCYLRIARAERLTCLHSGAGRIVTLPTSNLQVAHGHDINRPQGGHKTCSTSALSIAASVYPLSII